MPPAQFGNSYLNFLSTHDGIGLRPLEGILPNNELKKFISTLQKFWGTSDIQNITKEKDRI